MIVDGVRYVEAPEPREGDCCHGCAFRVDDDCHVAQDAGMLAFGGRCGKRNVIYIRATSEATQKARPEALRQAGWIDSDMTCNGDAEIAAELRRQHALIQEMRAALLSCARQAEALKRECGMDPESAQAVRNGQYQNISTTAHIALGTIGRPSSIEAHK